MTWQHLHSPSAQRGDFVSDYAQTNEKEDFAETFRAWMSGSHDLLYGAVYAGAPHPVLLQKLLYMASLFTDAASHTITFYRTAIDFTPDRVAYSFTPDTLTIDPAPTGGAYGGQLGLTFNIQNHAIVSETYIS